MQMFSNERLLGILYVTDIRNKKCIYPNVVARKKLAQNCLAGMGLTPH